MPDKNFFQQKADRLERKVFSLEKQIIELQRQNRELQRQNVRLSEEKRDVLVGEGKYHHLPNLIVGEKKYDDAPALCDCSLPSGTGSIMECGNREWRKDKNCPVTGNVCKHLNQSSSHEGL